MLRGRELLASEIASQVAAHQPYGGVVPEVASRHHLQRVPQMLARAVATGGISLGEVDAFAATSGPGLASSLMRDRQSGRFLERSLGLARTIRSGLA